MYQNNVNLAMLASLASKEFSEDLHVRVFAGPSTPLTIKLDKYEMQLEQSIPVPYKKSCIFTGVEEKLWQKPIKVQKIILK